MADTLGFCICLSILTSVLNHSPDSGFWRRKVNSQGLRTGEYVERERERLMRGTHTAKITAASVLACECAFKKIESQDKQHKESQQQRFRNLPSQVLFMSCFSLSHTERERDRNGLWTSFRDESEGSTAKELMMRCLGTELSLKKSNVIHLLLTSLPSHRRNIRFMRLIRPDDWRMQ